MLRFVGTKSWFEQKYRLPFFLLSLGKVDVEKDDSDAFSTSNVVSTRILIYPMEFQLIAHTRV